MKHSRQAASTVCEYCGRSIRNSALAAHQRACRCYPGEPALREMRQERKLTIRQIADRCGVGRWAASGWLANLNINGRNGSNGKRPPVAEPELEPPPAWLCAYAPHTGRHGACDENCPGWPECQRRAKLQLFGAGSTLWPLCHVPLPHEVARAIQLGYIHEQPIPG